MVTIVKLYILFICFNFGWGMLATGIVNSSIADGGQPCPVGAEVFDDNIHHKLCEVGVRFPDFLLYDAPVQSSGQLNTNEPVSRTYTAPDGSIYEVILPTNDELSNNNTAIASTNTGLTAGYGSDVFSFLDDVSQLANFGATLFLNTFTGGFILDVLGNGIIGVDYPAEFLLGIKILIGIAIIGWFSYLILNKNVID